MPTRTFHLRVPVVLDLEVISSGFQPDDILTAVKDRFAGVADPFCGTQVLFGGTYTAGHIMGRTRNATLMTGYEVSLTPEDAPPPSPAPPTPSA